MESDIWYTVYFKLIDTPNTSKESFLFEHGIKKGFQAYAYVKEKLEYSGIVFMGYRSRIDKTLEMKLFEWGTQRKIRAENLHKGMKVYLIETKIDKDTSEVIEDPKLRIVGSLEEMWLCHSGHLMAPNKKIRKLFP